MPIKHDNEAGVTELAVHDADAGRRDALIGKLHGRSAAPVCAGSSDPTGFDLIAHATPAGMAPGDPDRVELAKLAPSMVVGCAITRPPVSPLVAAARRIGCRTAVGGDMYAAEQALIVDFLLGAPI